MAAAEDRDTSERGDVYFQFPVKGGVRIFAGTLVVINGDAGLAEPGKTGANLRCVGVAQSRADNRTGVDGAENVFVKRGMYLFDNSAGGDRITLADLRAPAYIVDDQTVAKSNGGNTRSVAGQIMDIDNNGVWISI